MVIYTPVLYFHILVVEIKAFGNTTVNPDKQISNRLPVAVPEAAE
jgi:hypothetical protein